MGRKNKKALFDFAIKNEIWDIFKTGISPKGM